jgi:hypothetical protein
MPPIAKKSGRYQSIVPRSAHMLFEKERSAV